MDLRFQSVKVTCCLLGSSVNCWALPVEKSEPSGLSSRTCSPSPTSGYCDGEGYWFTTAAVTRDDKRNGLQHEFILPGQGVRSVPTAPRGGNGDQQGCAPSGRIVSSLIQASRDSAIPWRSYSCISKAGTTAPLT